MEPEDSLPHSQVLTTCPCPEYLTATGVENYRTVRKLHVQSDLINDLQTYSYAACCFAKTQPNLSLEFKRFSMSKQHVGVK